jgi:hypothetical protein
MKYLLLAATAALLFWATSSRASAQCVSGGSALPSERKEWVVVWENEETGKVHQTPPMTWTKAVHWCDWANGTNFQVLHRLEYRPPPLKPEHPRSTTHTANSRHTKRNLAIRR